MGYVNVETERGDAAELVIDVDRDEAPMLVLAFQDKDTGGEICTFIVEEREVVVFFEEIDNLKKKWEQENR